MGENMIQGENSTSLSSTSPLPSSTSVLSKKCTFPLDHGTAIVLLNIMFSVFGTFGNIIIIVVVYKTPKLRRISNFLLLSLAVADLFVTMIAQPLQVTTVAAKTFGHFCVPSVDYAYDVVANFSCSCSLFHLAAISVDRALVVSNPHRYHSTMGKYGLKIMLCCCWGSATLFVSLRVPFPETLILSVLVIFVSYFIIIVSYSIILYQITRERVRGEMPGDSRAASRDARMERRVAGTIAIVILVFSICWFPLVGIYVSMKNGLVRNLDGVLYMWIRTLLLFNSSMNFLIYSFRIDHFRSAYKKSFRQLAQKSRALLSSSKTASTSNTATATATASCSAKQISTNEKRDTEEELAYAGVCTNEKQDKKEGMVCTGV
ncbi:melanocortin receptor 5-like [Actinia tenebrosa]|uniref:Melanocortin receptor 5-like n=1 Tax=Actinia tenebrosa TaxID=6105 RepID=A0A6P8J875_ACTTE|nr:melanocortin receptor 5-like [Actinia tenebrosa]